MLPRRCQGDWKSWPNLVRQKGFKIEFVDTNSSVCRQIEVPASFRPVKQTLPDGGQPQLKENSDLLNTPT